MQPNPDSPRPAFEALEPNREGEADREPATELAPEEPAFQFGLGRLMAFTAACAVVLGWVKWLNVPLVFQLVLVGYFVLVLSYAILRGPWLYRHLTRSTAKWKRLRAQRQELQRRFSPPGQDY